MDLTVQELRQKLDAKENFLLLDVRESWEYDEFNIGGKLLPLGDLMSKMSEIEDYKDGEVVVHCRSGARSAMAQGLLLAAGFKKVLNLKGGSMAWLDVYGKGQV